jgi:hypothetical protein
LTSIKEFLIRRQANSTTLPGNQENAGARAIQKQDEKLSGRSENIQIIKFFQICRLCHALGKQFPFLHLIRYCFYEHVPPYPQFLAMAEAQSET